MLRVSYDTKPFKPPVVSRVRLHVIDSFINEERILLDEKIKILLVKGYNRESIKKIYDKTNFQLEEELEKKRIFMIKLRAILSWRRPEAIKFIKELNKDNEFNFKNIVL
jgi:hypothetical protein